MESVTDWLQLWRQLVEAQAHRWNRKHGDGRKKDAWLEKARKFDKLVRRRWARPDSSRSFVVSQLEAHPDATVLDIGAGTGAWAALLAAHAERVTAIEPSSAMIKVMEENLTAAGFSNVDIVQGTWPDVEAEVEPHDFSLCSHAMYGCADLEAFVRRMIESTRRTCFLIMRVPTADGVMAAASRRIWGQPHDSPNFQVAYNALLQMSIYPNVLMEDTGLWDPWTHDTLQDALHEVKRRFGLREESEHDPFLRDLLEERLNYQEGEYVWPPGVRSALVYWGV